MDPQRVVFLLYPGVQSLDVCGPYEVFQGVNRWLAREQRPPAYQVQLAAASPAPIASASGLGLVPDTLLSGLRGDLDTLIVPGGEGSRAALQDRKLVQAIQRLAARSRRVVSVCTGAFLLAEAGLLAGRRATTHWASCQALAQRYPEVAVEHEPIYIKDGRIYTSAGVTAGMDLALALIEEDVGRAMALRLARWLVLYLRRPGGQAQFSAHLEAQTADRAPLREVQTLIAEHPAADLSLAAMAKHAAMSVRHFSRCFRHEIGVSPAHYVDRVRIEAATRRLVESQDGVAEIAARCGFQSAEVLRRAFIRRLGVPPAAYRSRFQSTQASQAAQAHKEARHADRLPLVRPLDHARRRRALRGAEPPTWGEHGVRRR